MLTLGLAVVAALGSAAYLARGAAPTLDPVAEAGRAVLRLPASDYASAFAVLGDNAATLAWLDSMLVQRDSYMHQVRLDPVFDFERGKPGYREWERRSGLPGMPAYRFVPDSVAPGTLAPLR